jgi:hypothetical protein
MAFWIKQNSEGQKETRICQEAGDGNQLYRDVKEISETIELFLIIVTVF